MFDTDNSGVITQNNLLLAFQKMNKPLTQEEARKMIFAHDLKRNGVLDFEEFDQIFKAV